MSSVCTDAVTHTKSHNYEYKCETRYCAEQLKSTGILSGVSDAIRTMFLHYMHLFFEDLLFYAQDPEKYDYLKPCLPSY